jgi:hypothetical protein
VSNMNAPEYQTTKLNGMHYLGIRGPTAWPRGSTVDNLSPPRKLMHDSALCVPTSRRNIVVGSLQIATEVTKREMSKSFSLRVLSAYEVKPQILATLLTSRFQRYITRCPLR